MAGRARASGMGDCPTHGADVHRMQEQRAHQRAASTLVAPSGSIQRSQVEGDAHRGSVVDVGDEEQIRILALALCCLFFLVVRSLATSPCSDRFSTLMLWPPIDFEDTEERARLTALGTARRPSRFPASLLRDCKHHGLASTFANKNLARRRVPARALLRGKSAVFYSSGPQR
jgi:hypothetical protein